MTRRPTLDRRTLLRGASGIAVALPFLEAMRPRRAAAAASPRRFVVFFTPNSTNLPAQGHPTGGTETNFTLGQELAPLEPIKSKCLFLSGLDNTVAIKFVNDTGGPSGTKIDLHCVGAATLLTSKYPSAAPELEGDLNKIRQTVGDGGIGACWGKSISVDQEIANNLGTNTPFKSLELGVRSTIDFGTTPYGFISYSGPSKAVPREDDPQKAFARIFSAPGGGQAGVTIGETIKQRRSVLDFVKSEYQSLCPQLGAADKAACDFHFQSIREVERRFAMMPVDGGKICGQMAPVPSPAVANHMSVANIPAVGRQQMDILALALACDLTRVASLQWSYARSAISAPWLGMKDGHHFISHSSNPGMQQWNIWFTQQLLYLANKMQGIQEGDGSLLDNSVIYYCSEVGESQGHGSKNMRGTLVGGCGGALRTGRWLQFKGEDTGRLNISFLNAMGIPATSFGDIKGGPLPNLG